MTPSVNDSSIGVVYGPDGYTDLSMTYGATGTFTNVQYSVNIQDSQGTPLYIDRGTYTLVPDIANNYHATVPVPLGGSVNWEITGTSASGGSPRPPSKRSTLRSASGTPPLAAAAAG